MTSYQGYSVTETIEAVKLCEHLWPDVPKSIMVRFIENEKVTDEDAFQVRMLSTALEKTAETLPVCDTLTSLIWRTTNHEKQVDASQWCIDVLNQIASRDTDIHRIRARQCVVSALLRNGLQRERLQEAFVMFALRHPDLCLALLLLFKDEGNHTLFEVPLDINMPFKHHTALHVCAWTGRSPILLKELIQYGNIQALKQQAGLGAHLNWYSALTRRSEHYPYLSSCRLCWDWVRQANGWLQRSVEYRFNDDMKFDRPIDAIVSWWTARKSRYVSCTYAPAVPVFTIAHECALECLLILIHSCNDNATVFLRPQVTDENTISLDSKSFVWSFNTPGSDMVLVSPREQLLQFCNDTETKFKDEATDYAKQMYHATQKIRSALQTVRHQSIREREELCDVLINNTPAVHGVRSIALLVLDFTFPILA